LQQLEDLPEERQVEGQIEAQDLLHGHQPVQQELLEVASASLDLLHQRLDELEGQLVEDGVVDNGLQRLVEEGRFLPHLA
jgi:hypothetical protein